MRARTNEFVLQQSIQGGLISACAVPACEKRRDARVLKNSPCKTTRRRSPVAYLHLKRNSACKRAKRST